MITVRDERWGRSDLKTTMLLAAIRAKREASRQGVDEALLVGDDGTIHEGASSTLHVIRGARLLTPPSSTRQSWACAASKASTCARSFSSEPQAPARNAFSAASSS